jgi:hypothetical protein
MGLAMLLPRKDVLCELPTRHRVQQAAHSPLYVVPEDSVGMGRVRVEMGQQTVFGPKAVDRMRQGKGSSAVVEVGIAAAPAVAAEEYGSLDSQ